MYLLDSDVVIGWLLGDDPTIDLARDLRRDRIAISVISHMELREGVINSRSTRDAQMVYAAFLRGTRVLVVSRSAAERAAQMRAELRRRQASIETRALDLLIAATAVEHRLRLVTRNVRQYADLPDIDLYSIDNGQG